MLAIWSSCVVMSGQGRMGESVEETNGQKPEGSGASNSEKGDNAGACYEEWILVQ